MQHPLGVLGRKAGAARDLDVYVVELVRDLSLATSEVIVKAGQEIRPCVCLHVWTQASLFKRNFVNQSIGLGLVRRRHSLEHEAIVFDIN